MLPTPNLDDRRFQDMVDDAKRYVQQRCPEWTDHNVSDPGVTVIETVASMVDEMFYRLNRVPDRLYLEFLQLLGVRLHPATAAVAEVVAWLSAPQTEDVLVPAGLELATPGVDAGDAVVFTTTRSLTIPPRSLAHVMTQASGDDAGPPVSRDDALRDGQHVPAFSPEPVIGDTLLFGLDDPAPSCAVLLHLACEVQGVGVDPRYPPLVWEAWTGSWTPCEVVEDGTGGLNRTGDVVLLLPPTHTASVIAQVRAGWLRCRVVEADEGYPTYTASPTLHRAVASTVGGTTEAVHARTVTDEVLGLSEGVPGQVFRLQHAPVVAGPALVLEVAAGHGWETWHEVDSFASHDGDDGVFTVDRANGLVELAPAVREPDGSVRLCGAVPPKGAPLRLVGYRTGGGPAGNVAAGAISVMRTPVPFVDRVENRRVAHGGVAAETVAEVRRRGPMTLRVRDRAVTTEDIEAIASAAAPQIARVRAFTDDEPGAVRVLLVPSAVPDEEGVLRFEDMVPQEEAVAAIVEALEERRTVGARIVVEPPSYQGVTVVARLAATLRAAPALLELEALRALNRYFDPLVGGPDGTGWPFGRPVQTGEVYAVLQRLPGTDLVEDVRLFAADPITGKRGEPVPRIDIDPNALVFSFRHQVRVGGRDAR
ncbi:putative phage baseplate assembly protein [Salana multivorans]|uniref:Putative phage baseplate assembly protein n=1 Tax=Salana multivorans TaxID=120377 RepID=A0A3N2DCV3_9MICO|nr:putative baseplate assembly protein [Salana multivorans]ROR97603.1 putative phage baseplate assembly protein [Salana multivorans]